MDDSRAYFILHAPLLAEAPLQKGSFSSICSFCKIDSSYCFFQEVCMEFKNSRTAQNLLSAFGGESMARNKYLFFAEKARQEGHAEVAAL